MTEEPRPLVSVLIPVYNVELYVKEAVQSIQNQTYTNLEIIIIDDGSTDATYSILEELAKNDPRIKLYKNEKNLRIVKTLNRALSLASGDYIARMDGDDISALDRIEKKVQYLNNYKDIGLVGCSLITVNEHGEELNKVKKLSNLDLIKNTIKYTSPVSHIWLARKSVYEKLNGYREMPYVEDYDFLLRMLTENLKFTNIPNYYGYSVRLGREGNTASTNGLFQWRMHILAYNFYKERLKKGFDTFNNAIVTKSTPHLSSILFNFSNRCHQKAREMKSKQKYFLMTAYMLLSLISPHKSYSHYRNIIYRFKIRNICE